MTAKKHILKYYGAEGLIEDGHLMCHPLVSTLEEMLEDYAKQKALEAWKFRAETMIGEHDCREQAQRIYFEKWYNEQMEESK